MKKIVGIIIILLISVSAIVAVAIDQDYVAVNLMGVTNLETHEPIGSYNEIDIDDFVESYPLLYDEFVKIPHINDIKKSIYLTRYSADVVMDAYHNELTDLGYSLQKYGHTVFAFPFNYRGYVKFGTAVGILVTDAVPSFDTLVLYTTGSSLRYQDISNYFKEKQN